MLNKFWTILNIVSISVGGALLLIGLISSLIFYVFDLAVLSITGIVIIIAVLLIFHNRENVYTDICKSIFVGFALYQLIIVLYQHALFGTTRFSLSNILYLILPELYNGLILFLPIESDIVYCFLTGLIWTLGFLCGIYDKKRTELGFVFIAMPIITAIYISILHYHLYSIDILSNILYLLPNYFTIQGFWFALWTGLTFIGKKILNMIFSNKIIIKIKE